MKMQPRKTRLAVTGLIIVFLLSGAYPVFAAAVPPSAESVLSSVRKEAEQECQAEQTPLGGIMNQFDSLPAILGKGINKTLGNVLSKLFSEKIPAIIQKAIREKLPQLIQEQLTRQLPSFIQSRMSGSVSEGASDNDIRTALSQITLAGVEELVPEIIRQGVPEIIGESLNQELPPELVLELQAQLTSVLETPTCLKKTDVEKLIADQFFSEGTASELEQRLPEMFAEKDCLTQEDFQTLLADQFFSTIAATELNTLLPDIFVNFKDEVNDFVGGVAPSFSGEGILGLIPPSQSEINAASDEMYNGVVEAAGEGLNNSEALLNFINQIASVFADILSPQICDNLSPVIDQAASSLGGSGANSLSAIFGQVPGIGGDMLSEVGSQLDNTLKQFSGEVGNAFGNWAATGIRGFQIDSVLNSPTLSGDVISGQLVQDFNDIPGVHVDSADVSFIENPDGTGYSQIQLNGFEAEGFSNSLSADASSAVVGSSGSIASSATSQFSFSNISDVFKSGAVNALSGGLSGLVSGIPVAGPLLAPLVQNFTQKALGQLFGVTLGGGLPVMDQGVQGGVDEANKTLGKVEGNTKTSNENEKQLIDLSQKIESLSKQICTHEKFIRHVAKVTEEKEFVHDPNASKAAIMALSEMKIGFVKYFQIGALQTSQQTGVQSPTEGTNGGPLMVQNQGDEKAAAQKEAGSVVVEQVQQTAKINDAREISEELQKQNAETALSPFYSTLSDRKSVV